MKSTEFVQKLKDIATKTPTLYVQGCYGAPLKSNTIQRYIKNSSLNLSRSGIIQIHSNTEPITFGFDCVCLIKSVLDGWNSDATKPYGGADYKSGVPDTTIEQLIKSGQYAKIDTLQHLTPGMFLSNRYFGHIGVYIGNDKVLECNLDSSAGIDGVIISDINDRSWYWGCLSDYIDYTTTVPEIVSATMEFWKSKGWIS